MSSASATILRRSVIRSGRRQRTVALLLLAPLAVFLALVFLAPIVEILSKGIVDDDLGTAWPNVTSAIKAWNGDFPPGEPVFQALATDMKASQEAHTTAGPARRLNYALVGGRTLVTSTARRIASLGAPEAGATWRDTFTNIDPAWDQSTTWAAVRQAAGPVSGFYLLQAVDLRLGDHGSLRAAPDESRIYLRVLGRTFVVAGLVTAVALLLGFPVAYFLANGPSWLASPAMILVLLPLWTSLIARTAAWVVLLQDHGIINDTLQWLGVTSAPIRLIFNRVGLNIAMVHVSLPYMVLPIYATMATVNPNYMRAARSLGAPPTTAFRRVYLPQTVPGVAAGILLVFIMSLGYYITPALIGGADDQLISYFIAFYTTDTVNWGMAGALAIILLLATALLYAAYVRLTGSAGVALG